MEVAFIAPKALAQYSLLGDYIFLLPQNSCDFYIHRNRFKMLDNGAYEGGALDLNELLGLAHKMHVDEITIPDVMYHAIETYNKAKYWATVVKRLNFKVAVVPQGQGVAQFIECYRRMIKLSDVDTICFPKWLGANRPAVVKYLAHNKLLKRKYEYHLFGLDRVEELFCYEKLGIIIRSVDTSMPFSQAYYGEEIRLFQTKITPRIPWDATQFGIPGRDLEYREDLFKRNCKVILDVAHDI